MPKKLTKEYFDSLVGVIAEFPNGALISEIIDALDSLRPKRTLQNHLSKLAEQERIFSTGKTPIHIQYELLKIGLTKKPRVYGAFRKVRI